MKKLLIVIDSLGNGGAEKSLINLLSLIDYSKYNIDLALFSRGGINEKYVPAEVNYLPVITLKKPHGILASISYYFSRIVYSISARLKKPKTANDFSIRFWHSFSKYLPEIGPDYDVAFAYAQRLPTLYVASKVHAKHKYAWMNVTIHHDDALRKFYLPYFRKFDKMICVSTDVEDTVLKSYPELQNKTKVIYDINNPDFIKKLSGEYVPFDKYGNRIDILTVARLNFEQKGYDILLKACKILKERGYHFKWRALGDGENRDEIRRLVVKYQLEDYFELCGIQANPYPYFSHSDIYVQTSRYEGFGLSIAEARILGLPVVTTPYDCVNLQIKNGINGIISTFDPEKLAKDIARLIDNRPLYDSIHNYLIQNVTGNVDEFGKIEEILTNED